MILPNVPYFCGLASKAKKLCNIWEDHLPCIKLIEHERDDIEEIRREKFSIDTTAEN